MTTRYLQPAVDLLQWDSATAQVGGRLQTVLSNCATPTVMWNVGVVGSKKLLFRLQNKAIKARPCVPE